MSVVLQLQPTPGTDHFRARSAPEDLTVDVRLTLKYHRHEVGGVLNDK